MRRLLGSMVVGAAAVLALAGCRGVSAALSEATSSSSPSAQAGGTSLQAAGPVSAGSGALRVIAEPQAGVSSIYQLINGAKSSVDLTMYTLRDTAAEDDLAAAAKRGVNVRVILDQHFEKKFNKATYSFLSKHGVHVTWAP